MTASIAPALPSGDICSAAGSRNPLHQKKQFLYQGKRCHSEWFLNYPASKQAVDVRNFSNL
jgi:hypothetical protein